MSAPAATDMSARLGELANRILIAEESCASVAPQEGVAYDEEREFVWRQVNGYHDGLSDAWRLLTSEEVPVNTLSISPTYRRLVWLLSEGDKTSVDLQCAFGRNRHQIDQLIYRAKHAGYRISHHRQRHQAGGKDRRTYYYSLAEEQRLGAAP